MNAIVTETMRLMRSKQCELPLGLLDNDDFFPWMQRLIQATVNHFASTPHQKKFEKALLQKAKGNHPLTIAGELLCLCNLLNAGLDVTPEPSPRNTKGPDFEVMLSGEVFVVEVTWLFPGRFSILESEFMDDIEAVLGPARVDNAYGVIVEPTKNFSFEKCESTRVAEAIVDACRMVDDGLLELPASLAICRDEILTFPNCEGHEQMVLTSIAERNRPLIDMIAEVKLYLSRGAVPGILWVATSDLLDEERHRLTTHKLPSKEAQAKFDKPSLLVIFHYGTTVKHVWAADDLCGTRKLDIHQASDGNWYEARKYRDPDGYFTRMTSAWNVVLLCEVELAPLESAEPLTFTFLPLVNPESGIRKEIPERLLKAIAGGKLPASPIP